MTIKLLKNKSFHLMGKVENCYTSDVSEFGNGAKIDCRKRYRGRTAIVLILKEGEEI